jgi:hypothetical protein
MIKVGDVDKNLNSINFSNKILSGGLIKNMMVNFGI